jgi:hypothetical protein
MRFIYISIFILVTFLGHGQRLLLEMPWDPINKEVGPNRSHYGNSIISFGLNGLFEQGVQDVDVWNSANFNIGGRYIRKLGNRWAWSNDFLFNFFNYRLNVEDLDPADLTERYGSSFAKVEHEGRSFTSFEYAPGIRFSTQRRRGNIIGRYIEIQALGGVIFARSTHVFGEDVNEQRVHLNTRFQEDSSLYYGGVLRFGFNRISLYARYIANDIGRLGDVGMMLYGVELAL